MTKISQDTLDLAERVSRRRARLFPLFGTALIIGDALTSANQVGWAGTVWLALFFCAFLLVVTGGNPFPNLRRLTEDETTRANRHAAILVGYSAGLACAAGLYIAAQFVPFSATQALQIALTTAVAAPLISFGALERRSLTHD